MSRKQELLIVLTLAVVQISHIIDFVIIMPLSPIFMRELDLTPGQFGTLVSSYGLAAGVMAIIYALVANRFDRKTFLITCMIFFTIATFLCGLSNSFITLLLARLMAGAFGGILNSIVFAIATDLIPFERRGRAFGIIMSAFSVSSVVGVPLGLWISDMSNWHWSFYSIGFLAMLVGVLCTFVIPQINNEIEIVKAKETFIRFKEILLTPLYVNAYAFIFILAISAFSIIPFISPYAVQNIGILESDLKFIYLVGGIFTVISARIIGVLTDKIGAYKTFTIVGSLSLIPIYLFTTAEAMPLKHILIYTTLFMVLMSGRFIPTMTLVTSVATAKDRGSFMAIFNSIQSLGSAMAAMIGGLIIVEEAGKIKHFDSLGVVGICLTVTAIGIATLLNYNKNKAEAKAL